MVSFVEEWLPLDSTARDRWRSPSDWRTHLNTCESSRSVMRHGLSVSLLFLVSAAPAERNNQTICDRIHLCRHASRPAPARRMPVKSSWKAAIGRPDPRMTDCLCRSGWPHLGHIHASIALEIGPVDFDGDLLTFPSPRWYNGALRPDPAPRGSHA